MDFKVEPKRVLKYFSEICKIPHGSYNVKKIADYCVDFAKKHSLKFVRDTLDNVIIFKNGSAGYENAEPLILQGHTDMVCAKEPDCEINFLCDGLCLKLEGDFLKAKGTTLGADNGIAVAMIFAVLESDNIPHPPLEVVLTSDEEVGMLGAMALDTAPLSAKRMINLDSEDDDTVTVSCAGGSDFTAEIPLKYQTAKGCETVIKLKGLLGGHSGVEIDKGRVNALKLGGRVLNEIAEALPVGIISILGGDKPNAIPNSCEIRLLTENADELVAFCEDYLKTLKAEISAREPDFCYEILKGAEGEGLILEEGCLDGLIKAILCTKDGIVEMSAEIEGLVETSLNLGVLKIENDAAFLHFALRSNKSSALKALQADLSRFFKNTNAKAHSFGHYPPWEYKSDSHLQEIYTDCYISQYGKKTKVEAIHAGLECGVFAKKINGLDCISIGPSLFDVHTPKERLSISSLQNTYRLLLDILKELK